MHAGSQPVCAVVASHCTSLSSTHSTQAEKAKAKEAAKAANGTADEPPSGLEHVAGEGQVGAGWFVFRRRNIVSTAHKDWGLLAGQQVGGEGAACACLAPSLPPTLTAAYLWAATSTQGEEEEEEEEGMTPAQQAQHFAMRNLMNAGGHLLLRTASANMPQWLLCGRGAQLAAAPGFACPTSVAALDGKSQPCAAPPRPPVSQLVCWMA